MITRRNLVIALGASALAPLASFAQQQGKVWRVCFLAQRHLDIADSDVLYGPFTQGLRALGYVEGKNLVIEWRSAEGSAGRLPQITIPRQSRGYSGLRPPQRGLIAIQRQKPTRDMHG